MFCKPHFKEHPRWATNLGCHMNKRSPINHAFVSQTLGESTGIRQFNDSANVWLTVHPNGGPIINSTEDGHKRCRLSSKQNRIRMPSGKCVAPADSFDFLRVRNGTKPERIRLDKNTHTVFTIYLKRTIKLIKLIRMFSLGSQTGMAARKIGDFWVCRYGLFLPVRRCSILRD